MPPFFNIHHSGEDRNPVLSMNWTLALAGVTDFVRHFLIVHLENYCDAV
jgi:hypothetical protein